MCVIEIAFFSEQDTENPYGVTKSLGKVRTEGTGGSLR